MQQTEREGGEGDQEQGTRMQLNLTAKQEEHHHPWKYSDADDQEQHRQIMSIQNSVRPKRERGWKQLKCINDFHAGKSIFIVAKQKFRLPRMQANGLGKSKVKSYVNIQVSLFLVLAFSFFFFFFSWTILKMKGIFRCRAIQKIHYFSKMNS